MAVVAQLACVGAAVAPQLSSRLTGEDYRMEVRPIDPIDPFRGAYVTLDYPGLRPLREAAPDAAATCSSRSSRRTGSGSPRR